MKVYQISYNLRKHRNYELLHEKIKTYPTCCHVLKSTWCVTSNLSVSQIRNDLMQVMDNDDGLLITRLQGEGAWQNLNKEAAKRLKKQLHHCTI